MKKVLVLTTVAATLLGTVAFADSHGMGGKGGMGMASGPRMAQLSFAELDTNGDGQLTLEELTSRPADHFASADTDGDGGLSVEEMTEMMLSQMHDRIAAMAEQMVTRLDANKDGLIQADEMKPMGNDGAALERMFAIMDINGDGAVSQEEFDLVTARLGQMQQRMGQGEQGRGMMGQRGDNDDHQGMMGGRGFFGGWFGGRNH